MTQRFIQLLEVFLMWLNCRETWTACKSGQESIFLISTLRNDLLSSNYTMETTTTPRSVLNLNEVDVEKDLGIGLHNPWSFPCTVTTLLLVQQKFWECLRGHLWGFLKNCLFSYIRHMCKTTPRILCPTLVPILGEGYWYPGKGTEASN